MAAGDVYDAYFNSAKKGGIRTPQVYDPIVNEWMQLVRNYVFTGVLWLPQKGAAGGETIAQLAAGAAIAGKFGIDQVTPNANEIVVKSINAGASVLGKVGIDQTDGQNLVVVSGSNTGKEASDTITRGNDATPYNAGDVVSTLAGEVMEFASLGVANQMIAVLGTRMRVDLDAVVTAGITGYRLHLYNAAPTAIADNAAFNIPAADRAKYVGWVEISTPTRFDDTQWSQDDSINATFKLAGTSLFGILETLGAYTPTANAVKTIFLEVAGV